MTLSILSDPAARLAALGLRLCWAGYDRGERGVVVEPAELIGSVCRRAEATGDLFAVANPAVELTARDVAVLVAYLTGATRWVPVWCYADPVRRGESLNDEQAAMSAERLATVAFQCAHEGRWWFCRMWVAKVGACSSVSAETHGAELDEQYAAREEAAKAQRPVAVQADWVGP